MQSAYQFQYGDLHHTLIKVRWFVLDNLDGNDLIGFHILTLDYLAKRPLTENVQDEVTTVRQRLETEWRNTTGDVLVSILVP